MTKFVEIKTSELIGLPLDWAIAQILGQPVEHYVNGNELQYDKKTCVIFKDMERWSPSLDWEQGGQLIDKFKPWISPPVNDPDPNEPYGWDAEIYDADGYEVIGKSIGCQTALIAVCRAVVIAKFGEVVKVPASLVKRGGK